jgi:hypothetical protein
VSTVRTTVAGVVVIALAIAIAADARTPHGDGPPGERVSKNTFVTAASRIWRKHSVAMSALPHVVAARASSS